MLIKYFKSISNRKLKIAKLSKFQEILNKMLAEAMEELNYPKFKLCLLLGANPNIDSKTRVGYHLVTRCARSGEADFLETLIQFGGDVNVGSAGSGYTPLHMAAAKGLENCILVLIKYNADIHAIFELPDTNKGYIYKLGWTPLICACIENKTKAAKALLNFGANPLDINDRELSALEIAKKF